MTGLRRLTLAFAALAPFSTGALGLAQETPAGEFAERLEVTAVTVPVRVRLPAGSAPLTAAEIEVVEGGRSCPILALEPAGERGAKPGAAAAAEAAPVSAASSRPWRILIYIDLQLAGVSSVREAAWRLGGQAEGLAELGEVEVVVADDRIERLLPPSRDPEQIRRALRREAADNFGQRRLVRLRQEFFAQSNQAIGLARRRGGSGVAGSETALVRAFATQEATLLEGRRRLAERYFAERSVPDWPQAAFLVTGGYDLAPAEFYLPMVEGGGARAESPDTARLANDLAALAQGEATAGFARQLAALGWTLFPVLPYDQDAATTSDASFDGSQRWRAMAGGTAGGSLPLTLVPHAQEPWRQIGAATGGELVADVRKLDEAIEGLGERLLLTYQVNRPRDGSLLPLEVRSRRPGVEIDAPGWVAAGSPESLAAARARALLDGDEAAGDLPLTVRVEAAPADAGGQSAGRVEATVEFAPLGAAKAALVSTTIRFTIAVPRADGSVMVIHERATGADLSARLGWIFEARLVAPAGTPRIAVVAEELATGAWGGAVARWPS